jgi:hypothetical protein
MRVDLRTTSHNSWQASCSIGDKVYTAVSHDCASQALARRLVEGGIPDSSFEIVDGWLGRDRIALISESFHALARIRTHQALAQHFDIPRRERLRLTG